MANDIGYSRPDGGAAAHYRRGYPDVRHGEWGRGHRLGRQGGNLSSAGHGRGAPPGDSPPGTGSRIISTYGQPETFRIKSSCVGSSLCSITTDSCFST